MPQRRFRKRRLALMVGLPALGLLWANNASGLAPEPSGKPVVIAHRGVYQEFDHRGLGRNDCTATRIFKPTNPYLENTIPSMRASFAEGADGVELDVHPTTDGEFAVFHDWTLDCRTNGHGVTRAAPMTELKRLDIGYGYTYDGGRTFPFRGKGIGLMPTLAEVFRAFPDRHFAVHFKGRQPSEADAMVAYLARNRLSVDKRVLYYGDDRVLDRLTALDPKARIFSKAKGKSCTIDYVATGWSGHVPDACRNRVIVVPINYRWAFWGWPNRFLDRMKQANTTVLLLGPVSKSSEIEGLTTAEQAHQVPKGFGGIVWADAIQRVRPAL